MMLTCRVLMLTIGILLSASCGADSMTIPARKCFYIEVQDEASAVSRFNYGRQLIPLFDRFAVMENLDSFGRETAGGQYLYQNTRDGLRLSVTFGTGVRRANAVIFTDQMDCPTCERFERFLQHEIKSPFTLIPCSEVEDRGIPTLRNVDLRKPFSR